MGTNVAGLIVLLFTDQKLAKWIGPYARILGAFGLYTLVFLTCTIVSRIQDLAPETTFYLHVCLAVICGFTTAYLQNGIVQFL
jgi:hypothetical protein